jgi:enterochelin esterase-like enzyme
MRQKSEGSLRQTTPGGEMKRPFLLLLLLIPALITCQTAPDLTAPLPCDDPGIILHDLALTETKRGYDYHFQIYLPPCYELESEREYPVLFLIPGLGGGPAAWFQAGADQVADELILGGEVPPFLIVSTESTSSDPQGQIIVDELLPYVENEYRTLAERPYRAVAGASLGGIGTYRIVFQHPDLFATAGLFGSGLVSGEEALLQNWLAAMSPTEQPRVFFNTGEQDPLMLTQARAMIAILDEAGLSSTTLFGPGDHSFTYWIPNLPIYYKWLAEEWE